MPLAKTECMAIDLKKLAAHAEITISCEPEDVPVEGNALASGDAAEDRAAERWVRRQLARGNQWAWCTVIVRAEYAGLMGRDVLGCCSYKSERDFKQPGGYYQSMVDEALRDLASQLERVEASLDEVRS
jgi:hypothetical protein